VLDRRGFNKISRDLEFQAQHVTHPLDRPKPPKLPLQILLRSIIAQARHEQRFESISPDIRILFPLFIYTPVSYASEILQWGIRHRILSDLSPSVINLSCLSFFSNFNRSFRCNQLSVGSYGTSSAYLFNVVRYCATPPMLAVVRSSAA